MDFDSPPDDDPQRQQVRAWVEQHPKPSAKQLVEAGYVVPHWPKPYGLEAGPIEQLIIAEELKRAGIRRPQNPIGIGWAGPTILEAGTEEQKNTYLP
ncbi:MAG TPA: acyl-CoA dehydrogenase family protein, partial [Acidimicrobiales bacterium]|nr:acyl-CoA dehydrogenase family protein [Acidimicrobiales bacterium]